MRTMNQGAEYEEDTVDTTQEGEGDEDTSAGLDKIAGIPIKFLVIGGAVLIVLVLLVVVLGGIEGDDDVIVMPEASTDYQIQTPVVAAPEEFYWYTSQGGYLGISSEMIDGTVIRDGGIDMAIISSGGSESITTDTGITVRANLLQQDSSSSPAIGDYTSVSAGGYTAEQIETLKRLGYTGDEITAAARDSLDYEALVESAQALRDAEAADALIRMSDASSEEFQYLLYWGVFGFERREFTPRNNENISYNQPGSYLVNADYEKVDTYGLQLFLRVKIASNTYVYMQVDPSRWEVLPNSGNIVVRVNYVRYGTEEANAVYITSVVEQDISAITVNPEDSTASFDELTSTQ